MIRKRDKFKRSWTRAAGSFSAAKLAFAALILVGLTVPADEVNSSHLSPSWIIGRWHFVSYYYRNQMNPPLNPDLNLIFVFNLDGTDELSWTRKNQPGLCDRKGTYTLNGTTEHPNLIEEVTWVNPLNERDCGSDSDMQLGKTTNEPVLYVKGQLWLDIGLAGEDFYYVFEKTADDSGAPAVRNGN